MRNVWLAVVPLLALTLTVGAAEAKEVHAKLRLEGAKLHVISAPTGVVPNDLLIIDIDNVPGPHKWKLMAGTIEVGPPTAFDRYEITVLPPSPLNITVADPDNKVQLEPKLEISFDVTPASRPAPRSQNPPSAAHRRVPRKVLRHRGRGTQSKEVFLYFDTKGHPIGGIPSDVDDNDAIHVLMRGPSDEVDAMEVDISGRLATDEFAVLGGEALAKAQEMAGEIESARGTVVELVEVDMGTFGPFSAPSITVDIKKSDGSTLRTYTVRVSKTYLAGLSLGAVHSDIRFNHFDVAAAADTDATRIINTADTSGELRPTLFVTFYAWRFWEPSSWAGHSAATPQSFLDRLNPIVGIGLKKIGDEYVVGGSYELARGAAVTFGWHVARTKELGNGFQENQVFAGQASALPTRDHWESEGFLGVGVDLRVATTVLGAFLGTSK